MNTSAALDAAVFRCTMVVTDAHTDFAYNYSADGVLQSQGKFHATEHFTVTNGVIVRVEFDFDHVHGTFC